MNATIPLSRGYMEVASATVKVLVHKDSERTVLVKNYEVLASSGILALVDIASGDRFEGAPIDALTAAEIIRQCTILTAHAASGVPLGWAFVMDRMIVDVRDVAAPRARGALVDVSVTDVHMSGDRLKSLVSQVHITQSGATLARGQGHLRVVDPRSYRRLRSGRPMTPPRDLSDEAIGTGFVLTPLGDQDVPSWMLSYDAKHPFFFDHPVDHLPGTLLFSALCEAALLIAPPGCDVEYFDGRYKAFVELDDVVQVVAMAQEDGTEGASRVRGQILSGGRETVAAELHLRMVAAGD